MESVKYLIITTLCLGISYLSFKLVLRNETMFLQQRLYLVVSILTSVILPLTNLRIQLPQSSVRAFLFTGSPVLTPENLVNNVPKENFINKVSDLIPYIYITVSAALLLVILFQILRIIWLYNVSEKTKNGRISVLRNNSIKSPFSFFNWIFIPCHLNEKEEIEKIIIHESIHASQLHSLDNLIIEIISAFMWFNPFVWLMKKSLHLVHEYLADEGTLNSGIEKISYQALLINQAAEGKLINIYSSFNNNSLKKRMIMMTKTKINDNRRFSIGAMIPLSLILILVFLVFNGLSTGEVKAQSNKNTVKQEIKKINSKEEKSQEVKVIGYGHQNTESKKYEEVKIIGYGNKGASESTVYIVDGVRIKGINNVDPESIKSVDVNKEKNTVSIQTKSISDNQSNNITIRSTDPQKSETENLFYMIDGKEVSRSEFENISTDQIESMEVIKSKERLKDLTTKDYDGAIVIKTKK